MAGGIALADLSERPVDRLLHEVPLVGCVPLDQRQPVQERRVRFLLQVDRSGRNHRVGDAPDEFTFVGREFRDQFALEAGGDEKVGNGVDHFPRIAIVAPAARLFQRQFFRVGGKRGQDARLADAGLPKLQRAAVIHLHLPRHLVQLDIGEPEGGFGDDAEARHAGEIVFRAERPQVSDDLVCGRGRAEAHFSRRASNEDVSQRLPPISWTSP